MKMETTTTRVVGANFMQRMNDIKFSELVENVIQVITTKRDNIDQTTFGEVPGIHQPFRACIATYVLLDIAGIELTKDEAWRYHVLTFRASLFGVSEQIMDAIEWAVDNLTDGELDDCAKWFIICDRFINVDDFDGIQFPCLNGVNYKNDITLSKLQTIVLELKARDL